MLFNNLRQSSVFIPVFIVTFFFFDKDAIGRTINPDNDRNSRINVYYDCSGWGCYSSYIRNNVTFVNYVRDQDDADIYLRVTSASTGTGREYTLDFRGMRSFASQRDTIIFHSHDTESSDERRSGLTNHISLGLIPFVNNSDVSGYLSVSYDPPPEDSQAVTEQSDPWDSWIFDTNLGFLLDAEETESNLGFNTGFSAERITHTWKIDTRIRGFMRRRSIELSDGVRDINRDRADFRGSVVRSLGEHFSVGVASRMDYNRAGNTRHQAWISPALEFSVFPYSEFQERRIFIQYSMTPSYRNYAETTIHLQDSETIMQHELSARLRYDQPWGRVDIRMSGSNYFHDRSFNRLSFSPSFNIRLTRNLSFNISGRYRKISDQLSIPAGDVDDEDLLLGLQEQATSYDYRITFGFSYTFGSIYTGVVNPRL